MGKSLRDRPATGGRRVTSQAFAEARAGAATSPWLLRVRIKLRYALIAAGGAVLIGVGGGGVAAEVGATRDPAVQVVIAGQSGGAAIVPADSVVRDAGAQVVFVEIGNHVFRQPVDTGGRVGTGVVVIRGVSPGSFVVLSPSGLRDGETVRVK